MQTIRAAFTVRPLNPVSWAIRWANPISFVKPAKASHVIVRDGDTGYVLEASMTHGVRRVLADEALAGCTVAALREYQVPDAEVGLAWMRATAARHAKYDFKGAFGLGLAPDREWQEDTSWFCFEFLAKGLTEAGRPVFLDNAHVTATMLLAIIP